MKAAPARRSRRASASKRQPGDQAEHAQRQRAREPIVGMRKNVVPSVPTIEPAVETP